VNVKNVLFFAMACVLAVGLAGGETKPGFEQLKSLVGEWEGTTGEGGSAHVSYQLVSGGTALVERLKGGDEPEMVTVYTADGNHVAMTHYCKAGNQPQMRTAAITRGTKVFSFGFVRATNLESPEAGHMDHLVVTLLDKNHFSQAWTWKEKGSTKTTVFKFTRKS
jgi:hypothetical protein